MNPIATMNPTQTPTKNPTMHPTKNPTPEGDGGATNTDGDEDGVGVNPDPATGDGADNVEDGIGVGAIVGIIVAVMMFCGGIGFFVYTNRSAVGDSSAKGGRSGVNNTTYEQPPGKKGEPSSKKDGFGT